MTLNPVRPVFERLAYFLYLTLLVFSIGVTWLGGIAGFITGNFSPMLFAVAGLVLSLWMHSFGHAHWHFRECEASLEVAGDAGMMPRSDADVMKSTQCAALLDELHAAPDVWARGEVRRRLVALLEAAPALREEFASELAPHPDL